MSLAIKAASQLGWEPVLLKALYQLGLATGHYRRVEQGASAQTGSALGALFTLPAPENLAVVLGETGRAALLAEADEIAAGRVRLFGSSSTPLVLTLPGKLEHWSAYETGRASIPYESLPAEDIKFLWEPARFGWAFTLGRAYHLGGDERYARAFWTHFEAFTRANPPFLGPHWMNGQEVALRLMAFIWAGQVFASAPSSAGNLSRLAESVAAHAARIPPTLVYARSQQNNHLLTESAALLTAGLALPGHPKAPRWRLLGWRWLNRGLQAQIDGYGEYSQHSTNYQRLMLQTVLWVDALLENAGLRWPNATRAALTRSVHWLLSLMDPDSGRVPNLGANDGAYIFPLTSLPFHDHRPVLHAAARTFNNYDLPAGAWDEMALWLGRQAEPARSLSLPRYLGDQIYGKNSWAYLRTAQYSNRPSHADQLHLDLWWYGLNLAQDAGTYLYNAPAPWDNSLTAAAVHNTVTVNGKDQFLRAGRFLYLDWKDAYRSQPIHPDPAALQSVRGRYRGRGYRHTRTVSVFDGDTWRVEDVLLPLRPPWDKKPLSFRLHWLLPDWKWEIAEAETGVQVRLWSPRGVLLLSLAVAETSPVSSPQFSLVRAGELLHGRGGAYPTRGWSAPTYGSKVPALSLALETSSSREVKFTTEFTLPA